MSDIEDAPDDWEADLDVVVPKAPEKIAPKERAQDADEVQGEQVEMSVEARHVAQTAAERGQAATNAADLFGGVAVAPLWQRKPKDEAEFSEYVSHIIEYAVQNRAHLNPNFLKTFTRLLCSKISKVDELQDLTREVDLSKNAIKTRPKPPEKVTTAKVGVKGTTKAFDLEVADRNIRRDDDEEGMF